MTKPIKSLTYMRKSFYDVPKTIVGIPAYNEEKTIGEVIKKVKKYTNFVYVIDDGSNDKTSLIAKKSGINVLDNPINLGKGSTIRFFFRWLLDNKIVNINDRIILVDADGQCPTEIIPIFSKLMIKESADMIVARRDLSNYPFHKKIGNYILTKISSLLAGCKIEDSESGYRMFSYSILFDIIKYSTSRKYSIEMEENIIAGRLGKKIVYFPVKSSYIKGRGVKITDGIVNLVNGFFCFLRLKYRNL